MSDNTPTVDDMRAAQQRIDTLLMAILAMNKDGDDCNLAEMAIEQNRIVALGLHALTGDSA